MSGESIKADNSATLRVGVRHAILDTAGVVHDTILRNSVVFLYYTLEDAVDNNNLILYKLTDSTGSAMFYKLDSLSYTVRVQNGVLGNKIQSINTPHQSIVNMVITY